MPYYKIIMRSKQYFLVLFFFLSLFIRDCSHKLKSICNQLEALVVMMIYILYSVPVVSFYLLHSLIKIATNICSYQKNLKIAIH